MPQITVAVKVALVLLLPVLSATPHCSQYGPCQQHFSFVPAPPGHTPKCAKPGSTFCESVDHYPKQLIRYLIEKWGFDYNTLLSDESKDLFGDKIEYGPLPNHVYTPLHHHLAGFGPQPFIQAAISYGPITSNLTQPIGQVNQGGGYPDRRYKIDPKILTNGLQLQPPSYPEEGNFVHKGGGGFVYSTAVVEPSNQNQWWIRAKRSEKRTKRQASDSSNALCPTASTFVMPRAALNTRGNWMFTVNLNEVDDRYTQLVRSETCVSRECSGLCTLPSGYSSRCEQQYVQKRLVALEGNGERLYTDVFWFPHCCICQITPDN